MVDAAELFKFSASRATIAALLPELLTWKKARPFIISTPFPENISAIDVTPRLAACSFERELFWASRILTVFATQLQSFLSKRKLVEHNICKGDFTTALHELSTIEAELGYSFWSHETRIFLLSSTDGLEAQKDYTRAIKNDESIEPVFRFYAHYCSLRCEPGTSWWRYDLYVQDAIHDSAKSTRSSPVADYLAFLLSFFGPHEFHDTGQLIATLGAYPVIDLYEAFVRLAQLYACSAPTDAATVLAPALNLSLMQLPDERLAVLAAFAGLQHTPPFDDFAPLLHKCLDAYTSGDYHSSISLCTEGLLIFPEIFSFAELYAKSTARTNRISCGSSLPPTIEALVGDMTRVLLKTKDAEKSASTLRKRTYMLPSMRFSSELFSFVMREYVHDSFNIPPRFILFGDLNSSYYSPRFASVIPIRTARETFLDRLSKITPHSISISLFRSNVDAEAISGTPLAQVQKDRLTLHRARQLQAAGSLKEASEAYQSLIDRSDYVLVQDALLGLNRVYADMKDYQRCLDLLAGAYIRNPHLGTRLPLEEIVALVERATKRPDYSPSISLPIIYAILSRTKGSSFDARRDDAYEDFLYSYSARTPSELAKLAESFPPDKLIYFLRHVCVPDVMDSSVAFNSTEELLRERIGICRLLLSLDPDNADLYSDEIKQITQHLIVQRGVREVEQSKIYVEASGIRRTLEKSLRESYARYIDLLSTSPEKKGVGEVILELGKLLGPAAEQLRFLVPGNELQALFREMFLEVRDQFVSSNEFGLNGYLSTGLRHGTLAGQLRAPFEEQHLVTQRDEETMIYRDPVNWLETYSYFPPEARDLVAESLRTFSRQIDDVIDIVRTQWIQIHTESKPTNGLFDYTIPDVRLAALQSKVSKDTPYDAFVDLLFEHLWDVTERSLQRVRDHIERDLKPRLMKEVDALEQSINRLPPKLDCSALTAAITRARTSAQYAVDKMASWFRRAKASDIGPYALDLPIEIAVAVVKNIFPTFAFSISINTDKESRLNGKTLTSFATVLFLLFDNVRKHSGIVGGDVEVSASFNKKGEYLALEVASDIAHDTNLTHARERLAAAWSPSRPASFESVSKEGRSGLSKISRIFIVELGLAPRLDFKISDDFHFTAAITFDAAPLLVCES